MIIFIIRFIFFFFYIHQQQYFILFFHLNNEIFFRDKNFGFHEKRYKTNDTFYYDFVAFFSKIGLNWS